MTAKQPDPAFPATPAASVWQAGWLAGARRCPSPNVGARPAGVAINLVVIHSISLPPGQYGGDEVQRLFTNTLDWDAHPWFSQIRGLQVSAHFYIRRTGELWQFAPVRAPGMQALPAMKAAPTATTTPSASSWKDWKAACLKTPSTPRWPPCAARWLLPAPSAPWQATSTLPQAESMTPAAALTGRACAAPCKIFIGVSHALMRRRSRSGQSVLAHEAAIYS